MRITGVVRELDRLGRIVIPMELRRTLDIHEKEKLEFFVEKDSIILKKYRTSCCFCQCEDDLIKFKECLVCKNCLDEISNISR